MAAPNGKIANTQFTSQENSSNSTNNLPVFNNMTLKENA